MAAGLEQRLAMPFALVLTVFDDAEVIHQIDDSWIGFVLARRRRTGLR